MFGSSVSITNEQHQVLSMFRDNPNEIMMKLTDSDGDTMRFIISLDTFKRMTELVVLFGEC